MTRKRRTGDEQATECEHGETRKLRDPHASREKFRRVGQSDHFSALGATQPRSTSSAASRQGQQLCSDSCRSRRNRELSVPGLWRSLKVAARTPLGGLVPENSRHCRGPRNLAREWPLSRATTKRSRPLGACDRIDERTLASRESRCYRELRAVRSSLVKLGQRPIRSPWCESARGRLPEITNGCFVEAKHEKPALSIGQLWRNPKGGSGSGLADGHPRIAHPEDIVRFHQDWGCSQQPLGAVALSARGSSPTFELSAVSLAPREVPLNPPVARPIAICTPHHYP